MSVYKVWYLRGTEVPIHTGYWREEPKISQKKEDKKFFMEAISAVWKSGIYQELIVKVDKGKENRRNYCLFIHRMDW